MKRKQVKIIDVDYDSQRVTFTVDPRAVWKIDEIADAANTNRSEILREAVCFWLMEKERKKRSKRKKEILEKSKNL